jgi:hypothetical protein
MELQVSAMELPLQLGDRRRPAFILTANTVGQLHHAGRIAVDIAPTEFLEI